MTSESTLDGAGTSRRALIKKAALVGGAAWVAPTILNVSAAGAATVQCYSFKLDASSNDPNDCEASSGGACPPPSSSVGCPSFGSGGVVLSKSGYSSGSTFTIRLKTGCSVQYLAMKAGTNCLSKCSSESGCSSYRNAATNTWTFTQNTGNGNSHISLKVCCGS
jgi:hypothetical protein